MAGFCQAGEVGLALANWMTEGDPGLDVWAMDASRFGGRRGASMQPAPLFDPAGLRMRS